VLAALGDDGADATLENARARLDAIGVEGRGWDDLFRSATAVSAPL
jgi:hypothetical protein